MAITSWKKGRIGENDINWDLDGRGSQFLKERSTGEDRTDRLVGARSIPVSTTVRALFYADQTTATSKGHTQVDQVLAQIMADLKLIGVPDQVTDFDIAGSGGALTIKDGAIDANALAANAVTSTKILDGAVTLAKIGADAVDGTKIADNAVDSEHIPQGALDAEHYGLNSIGRQHLDLTDSTETMAYFVIGGGIHTCTAGASQTIASGLTLTDDDLLFAQFKDNTGSPGTLVISEVQRSVNNIIVPVTTGTYAGGELMFWYVLRPTGDITVTATP